MHAMSANAESHAQGGRCLKDKKACWK